MKTTKLKRSIPIFKLDELHPDGVRIQVPWDRMVIGASIFIPCIDTNKAIKQVNRIFKSKEWSVEHRVKVERGKLGVRIWRTA
jgi:hypothetical protein